MWFDYIICIQKVQNGEQHRSLSDLIKVFTQRAVKPNKVVYDDF